MFVLDNEKLIFLDGLALYKLLEELDNKKRIDFEKKEINNEDLFLMTKYILKNKYGKYITVNDVVKGTSIIFKTDIIKDFFLLQENIIEDFPNKDKLPSFVFEFVASIFNKINSVDFLEKKGTLYFKINNKAMGFYSLNSLSEQLIGIITVLDSILEELKDIALYKEEYLACVEDRTPKHRLKDLVEDNSTKVKVAKKRPKKNKQNLTNQISLLD